MQIKSTKTITVHLDDSDVRVNQVGTLLAIANDNGDILNVWLSAQGWEQLRQTIHQRTLHAADS